MIRAGDAEKAGKNGVSRNREQPQEQSDPELAAVIKVWPTLPSAILAAILAMIKAAKQ